MGLHANPDFPTAIRHALAGIQHTLKHERNLKVHALITMGVLVAGLVFTLRRWEWVVLVLTIGFVWSMELLNTAVEHAVDLVVGDNLHPLAKLAKDAAAGAVLVSTLAAVLVGMLIFVPHLWDIIF